MSSECKNVWELTSDALTEAGIDNYPPGIKKGTCKSKYVVFKQGGGSQIGSISSEVVYYVFMLYVPQNEYSSLSDFEEKVKGVLKEKMYPTLIPTGSKQTDYFDDNIDAHMRSFTYRNSVRNQRV